jgi:cell division protein FtsB
MLRRVTFPALLGLAVYYALFGGEYTVFDVNRVQAESVVAREALEELRASTESLRLRAERLEHDDRTLETLARERFGMIRPGEVLYRFADSGEEEVDG